MRVAIIAASAATALIGTSWVSIAQDQQKQDQTPPAARSAPPSGRAAPAEGAKRNAPPSGAERTQSDRDATTPRSTQQRSAQPRPDDKTDTRDRSNTDPARRNAPSKSASPKSDPQNPNAKNAAPKNAEGPDATRNASDRRDRNRNQPDERQTKSQNDRKQNDQKQAGQKQGDPANQQANRAPRVELTNDQRTNVRNAMRDQRAPRLSRVNFQVAVGTRVPRSLRLSPVPAVVFGIVPEYRNYRYFVVEDSIVIVDPATYEIVYVLESADRAGGATTSAGLQLSPGQRQMILRTVGTGPAAQVRTRLALGANVPAAVDLVDFPDALVTDVPALRPYRFVVIDRGVAIVDPRDRDIVLIVDR